MAKPLMFVSGILVGDDRTKNLIDSEKRAHTARISHQRRKLAKGQVVAKPVRGTKCRFLHAASHRPPTAPSKDGHRTDKTILVDEEDKQGELQYQNFVTKHLNLAMQPESILSVSFDKPQELKTFHVWTTKLSQRTARYGFFCRDVFLRIIPQRCLVTPALRYMVLAHAFAHEYKMAHPNQAHQLSLIALNYYTMGLRAMYETTDKDHGFLAAVCMAFMIEAGQNNFSHSMKHVRGYEEVLLRYPGKHDGEYESIKGCYYSMRILGEIMALGRLPNQNVTGKWTVDNARRGMAKLIRQVEDYLVHRDPLELHQVKTGLGQWMNAERDRYRSYEANLNRQATLLLLQLAITMLPEEEVGWLNYQANPKLVGELLSMANKYLEWGHGEEQCEEEELLKTLKVLADAMVRNLTETTCQDGIIDLLRRIKLRILAIDSGYRSTHE